MTSIAPPSQQNSAAHRRTPARATPAMQQRFERLLERDPGSGADKAGDRRQGTPRKAAASHDPTRSGEKREDQLPESRMPPDPAMAGRQTARDVRELENAILDAAPASVTAAAFADETVHVPSQPAPPNGPAELPPALARLAADIAAALATGRAADGAFQLELDGSAGLIAARVERGAGAALAITLQLPGADEPTRRRLLRDLARHLAERGNHECTLQLGNVVQRG